jgi:hypothetical protein
MWRVLTLQLGVWVMVFNATFNNNSVISWGSVLLVEKTTDNVYHIMLYRVQLKWTGFELTMLMVIGTDCISSCISNYHTITTMTACDQKSSQLQNILNIFTCIISITIYIPFVFL